MRIVALSAIAALVLVWAWSRSGDPTGLATTSRAPTYAGHAACARCHPAQATAWRRSQHARSMQPATPTTVLGRFDGARFTHGAVTSTFFRRDGRYFVRTDGPDGALADFEVKYTLGVYPLQQYLVAFPDGRKQALSIAWDARPGDAGGGRWFHLYPDEQIDHTDPLHWTRPAQNWNSMCADCHSTNLRRNYDAQGDRYATTWSDPSVACEACHGPGSDHVAWAERRPGWQRLAPDRGLTIALDERRGVTWRIGPTGNAVRSDRLATHREVETCAVCHARRRALGSEPGPTGRLLDTHVPALLEDSFYEVDGQQRDEVYTYGSFVQSRMYANGVTCSDCHEPHGATLRARGNALCARCHASATYEVETHLLHRAGSAGAQCVACHMPTRTYMQIDPRHDHSIRIPRPDLTLRYGVPNACGACHADRDAGWAAAAIEQAHGPDRKGFQRFADALAAGRTGAPGAQEKLAALAGDRAAPAIARATALAALGRHPGPAAVSAVARGLTEADPLLRTAALVTVQSMPSELHRRLAPPLAADPVKAVRVAAGRALAAVPLYGVGTEQRAACEHAVAAYVASEEALAEQPEAHLNLGIFYAERGDVRRAEGEYRAAIRLQPDFVPGYANLADLDRAAGRDDQAAAALAAGLNAVPDDPSLLHALGLLRVRQNRVADALPLLERAAGARPGNARFAYVYAVALDAVGRTAEATAVMEGALAVAPYDRDLLAGLATLSRAAGRLAAARGYAERLAAVASEGARGDGASSGAGK